MNETNRYAVQQGKDTLGITISEIKQFIAINIFMTFLRYPSYRMYWLSIPGLRCDIIANAMSLKRHEEIILFY